MRKNLPQNQTQKGVEKPTSPRLTLRFQSIRSRDEKSSSRAHDLAPSVSTASPKYQSYCVTMEARGDVYDLNGKKDELPTSTTSSALHDDSGTAAEVVSSSSPHRIVEPSSETVDTHEPTSMTANGSAPDLHSDEMTTEEATRKRRRSSNDSNSGGASSASGKQRCRGDKGHPRGPEMDLNTIKKRGGTSSSDTESAPSEVENDADQVAMQTESPNGGGSQVASGSSPKVPPLKIVLPSSSGGSLETAEVVGTSGGKERKVSSAKQALPYVVSTAESVDGSPESSGEPAEKERRREESTAERCQRVTRSSHRAALSHDEDGGSEEGHNSDVHPRKRKLRTREEHNSNATPSNVSVPHQVQHQGEDAAQPAMNGYQLFLNIRRQVQKRRHSMFIVHPKPPQGFKDYLLNRGSYVLEGNPSSRLSVPIIPPPQSLTGTMKDLFVEQESERYKLRLQHLIEREKLVLSAEQEILRVHGRAARAIQNQAIPLSACSILRDEEIYNVLEPEQLCMRGPEFIADKKEDRDKNVRSRYNGRLFLSWLQDVDDKWEKIKESMLLRHHNEAESLHAVQKLDWEWKLKELGLCDVRTAPVIDDICVPMVHVSDDFDLLPA